MKYSGFGLVIIIVFLIGCGGGSKSDPGSGCCNVPGINVEVVSPTGAAAVDDNPNQTLPITVQGHQRLRECRSHLDAGPRSSEGPDRNLIGAAAFFSDLHAAHRRHRARTSNRDGNFGYRPDALGRDSHHYLSADGRRHTFRLPPPL